MFEVIILTIFPNSWSNQKVQGVFTRACNCMIRGVKQFVMDQGIISPPNPKPGNTLNKITVEVVERFCSSDEVSRVMPAKRDYISIKVSGVKMREQKRLLLCSLKELYSHFKNSHPQAKVGCSKFATCIPETVLWQVCAVHTEYMYNSKM
jgi:hypothetical protein